MAHRRWRAAVHVPLQAGPLELIRADSPRTRLLGMAALRTPPPRTGLLLPRTRAVHTFGMRFALDLVWLDRAGYVIRVDRAVTACRFAACARARAVIELPAGEADRAGLRPGAAALPRRP